MKKLFLTLLLLIVLPLDASSDNNEQRILAATQTANSKTNACGSLGGFTARNKPVGANFYWQIGDANGPLAGGTISPNAHLPSYSPLTLINVSSASQLVFGAYVLQKNAMLLNATTNVAKIQQRLDYQRSYLTMRAGYDSFDPMLCISSKTVGDCFNTSQNNQRVTRNNDGSHDFYYSGGNNQALAMYQLGLEDYTVASLNEEIQKYIPGNIAYASPDVADGIKTTTSQYAAFLRNILNFNAQKLAAPDNLVMKEFLTDSFICTLPSACANKDSYNQAAYSPIPFAWHYGINHWIENDANGDASFSSPGLYGFYPWIDRTLTYYGIVAREDMTNATNAKVTDTSYYRSVMCGQAIRRAWLTGRAE